MGIVPTIDLSDGASADQIARAIGAACEEVGFFQVIGHGVDADLERQAWEAAVGFFGMPAAERAQLAIADGDAYGYGGFTSERLAASLGADTPPDLKETYSIGPPTDQRELVDDPAAAFVFSKTPWPIGPIAGRSFERTMTTYYRELAGLASRVMSHMAVALGLPSDWFAPAIDQHTAALRLLHYPDLAGVEIADGQLRAGAHTDYGTLTLLRQDAAPGGLQVRDVTGSWHDVPAVDGAYVVNVGDALERWTNDRWRSTLHRVQVPPPDAHGSTERFSIAFFHNANWDAEISCLPGLLAPGESPRYEPVTAGRHLMEKFRSTQ